MKKIVLLSIFFLIICCCGCGTSIAVYMEDGKDYKNTNIDVRYISSEVVEVEFSADIKINGGYVEAKIILVSNDSVIGECTITLQRIDDEEFCSSTERVELSYHNYGFITAYAESVEGWYYETVY